VVAYDYIVCYNTGTIAVCHQWCRLSKHHLLIPTLPQH